MAEEQREQFKLKWLKRILLFLFFVILSIAVFVNISNKEVDSTFDQEKLNLYFFYGDGCPHCAKEEIFLEKLIKETPEININYFEVWQNSDNAKLLAEVSRKMNFEVRGVPVLVVGDEQISGYYSDKTTGAEIKGLIQEFLRNGCDDLVAPLLGETSPHASCVHGCEDGNQECMHDCGCSDDFVENIESAPEKVNVPLLGEINLKNVSLPVLTFIIAATDGFNPCAMWVLLFLISLLINMKDKKRMWILGSAFILTSGIVYFMFLSLWLELFLFLGIILWVRITIGLVALASGQYHLFDAYKNRDGGCHVISSEKRKRVFGRLREIVKKQNFFLALIGIILLAIAVNLVELVCSAGLPAVYTQVLALSNLPRWQYYAYFLFYILIFMLDDLLIFVIAMTTLRMKAISSSYTRWSGWIGGIIMVLVGLMLLFKPGWLMFG